jgi:hypothetical protein
VEARFLECDLCAGPFLVCRPCGFNQRYCGPACAAEARAESVATAQKKYRDTDEGRAQHADEEGKRRERERKKRAAGERECAGGSVAGAEISEPATCVGDQFVASPAEACMVLAMSLERRPLEEAAPRVGGAVHDVGSGAAAELLQWRVTTTPSTAGRAARVRASGEVLRCVCCGRAGRVIAVVVKGEEALLAKARAALRQRRRG